MFVQRIALSSRSRQIDVYFFLAIGKGVLPPLSLGVHLGEDVEHEEGKDRRRQNEGADDEPGVRKAGVLDQEPNPLKGYCTTITCVHILRKWR